MTLRRVEAGSSIDNSIALIEAREEYAADVNRPDAVVDYFEADVVRVEGGREMHQAGLEADRDGIGQTLHQNVVGYSSGGNFER